MRKERFGMLYRYVGREYIFSFIVAFFFFFFIFFVNQILVLAQKILLKNVRVSDVLLLVVLSIPQFLMYTMPFSSLASASMVIGNLSSQNEILALRSCGVHTKRIFIPIIAISLVLSCCTFLIADRMIPYTTERYRQLYSDILQSLPSLELESYSSTRFGKRVISNGVVDGNILHDVLIFDETDSSEAKVISASEGTMSVVDIDRFIYRIDLKNPQVLITDSSSVESYSLAGASEMTLYINLSSSASALASITPSQMSVRQLIAAAASKKQENEDLKLSQQYSVSSAYSALGKNLINLESGGADTDSASVLSSAERAERIGNYDSFSFYYQYYRSELQKKIALSLACTFLVFVAFPISFFHVKNGRLIGFGLSMLVACAYWFFLYFMHTRAIRTSFHPAVFLWAPNAVVFLTGIILLRKTRK